MTEAWVLHHSQTFQPHVFCLSVGPVVQSLKSRGIPVSVWPEATITDTAGIISFLHQYILQNNIDLVHSCMELAHVVGAAAVLHTSAKEVWDCHGPLRFPERFQGSYPLIPSSAIIVNSRTMHAKFLDVFHNAARMTLVPYGIEDHYFSQNTDNRLMLRKQLGINEKSVVFGMFGRIERWKGQLILLKAFDRLVSLLPSLDMRLCVIGGNLFELDDEYEQEMREYIEHSPAREKIVVTGHQEQVNDYYDMVDIVVHASTSPEPFGLVIVEAMAKGKVVLATRHGGPLEIITHGENGFLYEPGNIEELTRLLSTVIAMTENERTEMGRRARKSIEDRFTIRQSVVALENLYREILKEKS